MTEEYQTKSTCETMHDGLNQRLEAMDKKNDENFKAIFSKLDDVISLKGKVEMTDWKIEAIGKKFDKHISGHSGFIVTALSILTIASILITLVATAIKK